MNFRNKDSLTELFTNKVNQLNVGANSNYTRIELDYTKKEVTLVKKDKTRNNIKFDDIESLKLDNGFLV